MALKFADAIKKIDLGKATEIASGVKGPISSIFDRKHDVEDIDLQTECLEAESVDTRRNRLNETNNLNR